MKPKMIDLFAGCGGLSHGFIQAGYENIGFVEKWEPAITTFLKNHPKALLLGKDITKIDNKSLMPYKGKVEIIAGGPPCQGFSLAGKRKRSDKRNQLYKEYLRFVDIIEPNTVLIENVHGLLSMRDHDNEKIINKIISRLISKGYFVSYKVLKASDYGVPQDRKRLIIVAKKLDLFPKPSGKPKTVIESIQDLPKEENAVNGHQFFKPKAETLERIKKLQQGEKLCQKFNFSRQRLHADKPSKTIVTKPLYIHPYEDRFLSPRELARLQSFPDDFYLCGSKTDMVTQIGNAVPPLMAEAIARKLIGGNQNESQ